MAENNEIPENAAKILFAEDLVSFMMQRLAHVCITTLRADRYREFVYNGFSEITKEAIKFIDITLEMEHDDIFLAMKNANCVNTDVYMLYARRLEFKYFPDGFDANYFLHYCVHLATLAAYFHVNGIPEAPYLAILNIENLLNDIDMTTGGWDTVSRISEWYASMAQDTRNQLSPISEPPTDDDDIDDRQEAPTPHNLSDVEDDLDHNLIEAKDNCSIICDKIDIQSEGKKDLATVESSANSESFSETETRPEKKRKSNDGSSEPSSANIKAPAVNFEGKKMNSNNNLLVLQNAKPEPLSADQKFSEASNRAEISRENQIPLAHNSNLKILPSQSDEQPKPLDLRVVRKYSSSDDEN